jgi:hypothetical protein
MADKERKTRARRAADAEIQAMAQAWQILAPLSAESQHRVIRYLLERTSPPVTLSQPRPNCSHPGFTPKDPGPPAVPSDPIDLPTDHL